MDLSLVLIAVGAFLLGGAVKGIVGLGLPTVVLALLGTALGLREALLLLVAPAFLTNVWQAATGGFLAGLLKRLWPMLLATVPGIFLGTTVLFRADQGTLDILLGTALCAYAVLGLAGASFAAPGRHERVFGPAIGLMTGLTAGATGTLVLPVVPYLTALGLRRDELVQAMGLSFAMSSLTIGAILTAQSAAAFEGIATSLLLVVPALAGMAMGQRLRQRIAPARFRRWLFLSLLILGTNLIRRGLAALF
ncbi:sulfite exporter TauE/SafE family protein [Aurantimonas sp. A2-1-M11]|uniref:sulfite exporter TauE/SafE family protein n=1 Tax=Aurantimonas sp. A2-1-M11 TaxID=3113712 RepID=UPI002F957432